MVDPGCTQATSFIPGLLDSLATLRLLDLSQGAPEKRLPEWLTLYGGQPQEYLGQVGVLWWHIITPFAPLAP